MWNFSFGPSGLTACRQKEKSTGQETLSKTIPQPAHMFRYPVSRKPPSSVRPSGASFTTPATHPPTHQTPLAPLSDSSDSKIPGPFPLCLSVPTIFPHPTNSPRPHLRPLTPMCSATCCSLSSSNSSDSQSPPSSIGSKLYKGIKWCRSRSSLLFFRMNITCRNTGT